MYLFLPAFNKGISILNKYDFRIMVISILILFAFWRDCMNPNLDVFGMNSGASLIWLLTYYLIGAYIGKYRTIYSGIKKYIYCLICFLIYLLFTFLFFFVKNIKKNTINNYYLKELVSFLNQILTERYDSILKVIQSTSLSLLFMQLQYNKYISKIICFFGPLVFGIYLIHNNKLVKLNILKYSFNDEPDNISLKSAILLVLYKALKIFIICIIMDYFRHLIFILLRLKNICIYLEKKIRKILNKNS